jgi:hypothetical protein
MAVLVFGIYLVCGMGFYGVLVEGLFPKETRMVCNDSVDPLWPGR